jgi:hypothetical protein
MKGKKRSIEMNNSFAEFKEFLLEQ